MAKERISVRMQAQIKTLSEQGHSIRSVARILIREWEWGMGRNGVRNGVTHFHFLTPFPVSPFHIVVG
jgi:hypothetical protein